MPEPVASTGAVGRQGIEMSPLLSSIRSVQPGPLTNAVKASLVAQLLCIVRDYYVHLPLKMSSLAINPVQELELLRDDIDYIQTDSEFFARTTAITKRLRDRHTCIKLSAPLNQAIAYLPYALESFWENGQRRLVVSKITGPTQDVTFQPGVEITHWNGMPVRLFIERLAWDNEGGNAFARIAIALRSLTIRPLAYMALPDEDWVTLSYQLPDGTPKSTTSPWRVYFPESRPGVGLGGSMSGGGDPTARGFDPASSLTNGGWKDLFSGAQQTVSSDIPLPNDSISQLPNPFPDKLYFRLVQSGGKSFGYIRIFSFDFDTRPFLLSISEVLKNMPRTGVIVDLRGNPGGTITSGEAFLQLFTKRAIMPERLAFRLTPAVQRLGGSIPAFSPWRRSLGLRFETGQLFSQGFSITDSSLSEGLEGVYTSPVAVICDALCYSTTDFFVAGFQDNGIGPVIGTDIVTGAGGANVWTHSQLKQLAENVGSTELQPLPLGMDINVAIRRSTRVGLNDDLPVEGLGAMADYFYQLTRRDVLSKNEDLIEFACEILSRLPSS